MKGNNLCGTCPQNYGLDLLRAIESSLKNLCPTEKNVFGVFLHVKQDVLLGL